MTSRDRPVWNGSCCAFFPRPRGATCFPSAPMPGLLCGMALNHPQAVLPLPQPWQCSPALMFLSSAALFPHRPRWVFCFYIICASALVLPEGPPVPQALHHSGSALGWLLRNFWVWLLHIISLLWNCIPDQYEVPPCPKKASGPALFFLVSLSLFFACFFGCNLGALFVRDARRTRFLPRIASMAGSSFSHRSLHSGAFA